MRAAVLERLPAETLVIQEVSAPRTGAQDLLIGVEACGICGTDLHILEGHSYQPELPFVLGHEPVGRVRAVGKEVASDWVGRRVTMTLFEGCGHCSVCATGDERLCQGLRAIYGVDRAWGGFAEEMVIPSSLALEVPDELTAVQTAALVDAGATAMNTSDTIRRAGRERVLVLGGGPVGFLLVEILGAFGTPTTVVEPLESRASSLESLGHSVVTEAVGLSDQFDAVVDCTGVAAACTEGLRHLAPQGLFIVVGYTMVPKLDLAIIARRELRLQGIRSGSRSHLQTVIQLAASGAVRLPPISCWDLSNIDLALASLRAGQVPGKAVVEID